MSRKFALSICRFGAVLTLSTVAMAQSAPAAAALTAADTAAPQQLPPAAAPSAASALPPTPKGSSTVLGGEISGVDPVRDQFILKVFGGKSVKILFDERTRVYRDGVKISVLNLNPDDQASVETVLDGTTIFARSIHMLSKQPEGDCSGQVADYDAHSGELKINLSATHEHLTFHVPANAPVEATGQQASSAQQGRLAELARGSLVDVKFKGGKAGYGVATHISVLAVPGSAFIFSGNLASLDMHVGRLVIADPRDNKTNDIAFDPSLFSISGTLHEGSAVTVTTVFDGSRYVAKKIAMNDVEGSAN